MPAAWLTGIIAAALSGFRPTAYLEHVRQIPPPHPYPTATVVWIAVLMTVHAAVLMAILRPTSYSRS